MPAFWVLFCPFGNLFLLKELIPDMQRKLVPNRADKNWLWPWMIVVLFKRNRTLFSPLDRYFDADPKRSVQGQIPLRYNYDPLGPPSLCC